MIKCLSKGFVELENVSHDDCEQAIANSARVSYDLDRKDTTSGRNATLVEFLLSNRHTSPFECVSFSFHIKAPLSIVTQIIRHRTAKVNCLSHRYSKAEEGRFDPVEQIEDIRYQSSLKTEQNGKSSTSFNKQTSSRSAPDERDEEIFRLYNTQIELADQMFSNYEKMLEMGASREQARFYLPCGTYTRMHWTMDVHNLLHFLELRLAPDAQYEVRVYAEAILKLIEPHIPNVITAFMKYRLKSLHFDESEIKLLKELIIVPIEPQNISVLGSSRRQQAFIEKITQLKS